MIRLPDKYCVRPGWWSGERRSRRGPHERSLSLCWRWALPRLSVFQEPVLAASDQLAAVRRVSGSVPAVLAAVELVCMTQLPASEQTILPRLQAVASPSRSPTCYPSPSVQVATGWILGQTQGRFVGAQRRCLMRPRRICASAWSVKRLASRLRPAAAAQSRPALA